MSSNAVMKETPETVVAVLPKPGSVVPPERKSWGVRCRKSKSGLRR